MIPQPVVINSYLLVTLNYVVLDAQKSSLNVFLLENKSSVLSLLFINMLQRVLERQVAAS